ncbi:MAG TPA: hypothetical protein DEA96_03610 [Leptospiraceae bacterium]|nr:hypothetical protein [Spirochaetaceae bacterium]HBS04028.1 hypothetical protein [Leptospiraceae bacterium]|tara:strand:+ start:7555 stop:7896 length:342 start_codon:yes stop_codon:yes gene_type:complete
MNLHSSTTESGKIALSRSIRILLLVTAIVAALGPNALYLYALFTQPELNNEALANPVAQAFMIEAMMLLALFLWYVYRRTSSILQVVLYLFLAFLGSLAFSFPLFMFVNSESK